MALERRAPAGRITLDMPVKFLKGVGEQRAELLSRLGIHKAGDLLWHVPHRYEDASPPLKILQGVDAKSPPSSVRAGVVV